MDSKRYLGYSPDYVESMWLMMQQDEPNDYVIATGVDHTIRDFLDVAFKCIGVEDWSRHVKQNPRYMRPAEVDVLRGDSTKAKRELGWTPKTPFGEMVSKMVTNDIKLLQG